MFSWDRALIEHALGPPASKTLASVFTRWFVGLRLDPVQKTLSGHTASYGAP